MKRTSAPTLEWGKSCIAVHGRKLYSRAVRTSENGGSEGSGEQRQGGAGAITWLEPHSRVAGGTPPEAPVPSSSPATDILSPSHTHREGVPVNAHQRGVSLAGQNHRDDSDRQRWGEDEWAPKKSGSVLTINRYYRS